MCWRPAITRGCAKGEILGLRRVQVDILDGVIRLNAGETKNDEGRTIPMFGELVALLRARHANPHADCPFVCFRVEKGEALPIGDFRKVWQSRCVKLGLGKMEMLSEPKAKTIYRRTIFHDLRRTGVRNLVPAGVPESVAMSITGDKTRSVFDRYDITDEKDVGSKLDTYLVAKTQERGKNK